MWPDSRAVSVQCAGVIPSRWLRDYSCTTAPSAYTVSHDYRSYGAAECEPQCGADGHTEWHTELVTDDRTDDDTYRCAEPCADRRADSQPFIGANSDSNVTGL